MGKHNSTLTRVKPLFDFIDNDTNKLNVLFDQFQKSVPHIKQSSIHQIRYGCNEMVIPPSKPLLIWLLKNLNQLNIVADYGVEKGSDPFYKRNKLFLGDQETLYEAINLINSKSQIPIGKWYTFEGPTHIDIYIETDDSIFVGEAKRTESDIKTTTTWLKMKDQLIRHIDSLLDQSKTIYSFYILDKTEFYKSKYPKSMKLYEEIDYFRENLKHRDEDCILRAKESFIGFIFWDDLAELFNLTFPDTIDE